MKVLAVTVLLIAMLALAGAQDTTEAQQPRGALRGLGDAFNAGIQAIAQLILPEIAPAPKPAVPMLHPQTEAATAADAEFETATATVPAGFKRIATLIREVMKQHANTPEIRIALINKSLKTLRLDTISQSELEHFFPGLQDDFSFDQYLARIATCGAENKFLHNFVEKAANTNVYGDKTDAAVVIPWAFGYMVTLDRLTSAARHNHNALIRLKVQISKAGKTVPWRDYTNDFEQAKKMTIDGVVEEYTSMHKARKVPGDWGRRTLPLNIVEASIEDYRLGYNLNAESGVGIAFERPGGNADSRTGAGPSKFSPDNEGIEYNINLPVKYADSYSTWNMAFVSHYGDAPHFWAKLVNPAVFCYQAEPSLYLYNRVIALYLHIAAQMFDRADRKSPDAPYQWNDDALSQMWGADNHNSIYGEGGYLSQIKAATGEDQTWVKTKAQSVMYYFGEMHADDVSNLLKVGMELKSADSWSLTDFFKIAHTGTKATFLLIKALIFA